MNITKKKKNQNIFFYKSKRKPKIYLYKWSSFIFVSVTGWPKETQEGKNLFGLQFQVQSSWEKSRQELKQLVTLYPVKSREKWVNLCGFRLTHMMQEPLCLGDGGVYNGLHYQLSRQSPTDIPTGQLDLDNYSTEAPFPVKIMTTACIYWVLIIWYRVVLHAHMWFGRI